MSFGTKRFEVKGPGHYKLSDGTELKFLTHGDGGGVSVEEVLAVAAHRMSALRTEGAEPTRILSLAITDAQSAENWMVRWDNERRGK